ncbi:hypothetical protein CCHR01_14447 [Colletotrichum chrysophilum]|uniref:Uncharacterized protein n=1 Tax=Colletotrichum chrysophilum TaxID=1836956 RepID=A0AAD9A7I3_9PEZI|nr:hypothetical protein CCHR01_14447 [Colletotrichum chrysophilum]
MKSPASSPERKNRNQKLGTVRFHCPQQATDPGVHPIPSQFPFHHIPMPPRLIVSHHHYTLLTSHTHRPPFIQNMPMSSSPAQRTAEVGDNICFTHTARRPSGLTPRELSTRFLGSSSHTLSRPCQHHHPCRRAQSCDDPSPVRRHDPRVVICLPPSQRLHTHLPTYLPAPKTLTRCTSNDSLL